MNIAGPTVFFSAVLLGLATIPAVTPGRVLAQCTAVAGGNLKIKPATGNPRSRFDWKAKDKSVEFLIADPTTGTTTIELSAAGNVIASLVYDQASALAWRSSGNPVRLWKYKDRDDPSPVDGIEKIKSKANLFKVKGKQGIIDLIIAPLALPLYMRVTDSLGHCFLSQFSVCTSNDDRLIKCKADEQVCQGKPGFPAPGGTERSLTLDPAAAVAYPDPNPLRGFCFSQQDLVVGDRFDIVDRTFGSPAELSSPRYVRVELRHHHWPFAKFNDDPVTGTCEWLGVEQGQENVPELDVIVAALAARGDRIMLRMSGTPAFLSVDCDPLACASSMRPGQQGCSCSNAGAGDPTGYSLFPPSAYNQAFRNHWACVIKHYAALGVRDFEIWNEPDLDGSFRPDPANPASAQDQFLEMFEQIRVTLENTIAADPFLSSIAAEIQIGGPAAAGWNGNMEGIPGGAPIIPILLNYVDANGGELDFVSYHMYVDDPGEPFSRGDVGRVRSWIPAGWTGTRIDINEWQTKLGVHDCQIGSDDVSAPVGGLDNSVNCDHRGAGYAGYTMSGLIAAGSDVTQKVFELFERPDWAPDDFYQTAVGIVTTHGLPKPEAGVFWAAAQMQGQLLGSDMELDTDRSFGWIAALDDSGTVHVLLSQFESDGDMHFARTFRLGGHEDADLIVGCQCTGAGSLPAQKQCTALKLAAVESAPDRSAELSLQCPAFTPAQHNSVIDGFTAKDLREATIAAGQALTVGLEIPGIPCGNYQVDEFVFGPGTTSTEQFRAKQAPPAQFGDIAAMYSDQQWLDFQNELWSFTKTPTRSYQVLAGQPLDVVTVPQYGAVYLRIK